MGHICHRTWEQIYESALFELTGPASVATRSYQANEPGGTGLTFFVRAAPEPSELEDRPWRRKAPENLFDLEPTDRYLQYRAVVHSDNGGRFPTLGRVRIKMK